MGLCHLGGGGGGTRDISLPPDPFFHTLHLVPCNGFIPPPPCPSYDLVLATVGVGTILIWDLI